MPRAGTSKPTPPIGEVLRARRVEVLKKGLREMARELNVAPAYLTDIEKDRRIPSEDLLVRISKCYGIDEAELRSGWKRAEVVVGDVATQDAMTARKVPEFLRTARGLSSDEWDKLISQAKRLASKEGRRPRK